MPVVEYLLQQGANVQAKDKGLVIRFIVFSVMKQSILVCVC